MRSAKMQDLGVGERARGDLPENPLFNCRPKLALIHFWNSSCAFSFAAAPGTAGLGAVLTGATPLALAVRVAAVVGAEGVVGVLTLPPAPTVVHALLAAVEI